MMLVNSTTLRYLKLKYYAPKVNSRNLRILCKSAGNWFILEYIVVNIKPNYFVTLVNCLFDEFYDKRGKPLLNKTVMDKYKRINSDSFPTSYNDNHNNSYSFDMPSNNYNQFSNQFSNTNTFNQPSRHNAFLSPSSPTPDIGLPSIHSSSSKFGSATARRTKKKQMRSSISMANKSSDYNRQDIWDNQSNQETAPFLNELTELDVLDGPFNEKRTSKFSSRKLASKKDLKPTFGTTNDTSHSLNSNTDNLLESLPMNLNSEDEWK